MAPEYCILFQQYIKECWKHYHFDLLLYFIYNGKEKNCHVSQLLDISKNKCKEIVTFLDDEDDEDEEIGPINKTLNSESSDDLHLISEQYFSDNKYGVLIQLVIQQEGHHHAIIFF